MSLVLSLMPGIDLLGLAFKESGFCVVQGGDVIFGGDVRTEHYPPGKFDGVIGGPPCQEWTPLNNVNRARGRTPRFGNLIPEFERCVEEAEPRWFVMENIAQAPVPAVNGYGVHSFLINNRQFGEKQNRVRRWSFGLRGGRRVLKVETVALENPEFEHAAMGGGRHELPVRQRKGELRTYGYKCTDDFRVLLQKQGLPDDFELPGFTVAAKCQAVGNGVPMAMGRAIAAAVRRAVE